MNDKLNIDITEDEDVARAKAWWAENGKAIIGGVVLGTVLVVGYNYWKDREVTQAEAASAAYASIDFEAEGADSTEAVAQLVNAHGGTAYAVMASLRLAKQQANSGEFSAAADTLKNALSLKQASGELGDIVRLRQASALYGAAQYDEALAVLTPLDNIAPLKARVQELRADIFHAQNDADAARSAYQAMVDDESTDNATRQRVQMKLSNL